MTPIITPFRNIQQCINKINECNINEASKMIRDRFISLLSQYGRVYELGETAQLLEGDFFVLADTRGRHLLFTYCGASYELERTYRMKLENHGQIEPTYVKFESWIPEYCEIHCNMHINTNTNTYTLTLMPMTAAIIRFPKSVNIRVEPL
jgi:hypothetical protein